MSSQIGVIGLAVMGANLARNFASRGFTVSIFNRTYQKTQELLHLMESLTPNSDPTKDVDKLQEEGKLIGFENLQEFVASLERPRKIILMIKSGPAVDEFLEHLKPMLDPEDIVIDCGNSNWKDTLRRQSTFNLSLLTFNFLGCGVSGGEEGALHGPSIMPGGDPQIVEQILPLFQKIAAKDFNGQPCVTNIGLGPSGHFVKMVHNGIEYAMMQGIAEIYDILRYNSYSNEQIRDVFTELNQGELKSFLLDITVKIFETKDIPPAPLKGGGSQGEGALEQQQAKVSLSRVGFSEKSIERSDEYPEGGRVISYLIDKIKDQAGAKGTGSWTVEAAMELGVAVPSIFAALNARTTSEMNVEHKQLYTIFKPNLEKIQLNPKEQSKLKVLLKDALIAVFFASFGQGIYLLNKANQTYNWQIDLKEVLRIWEGGCIIRTQMIQTLVELVEQKAYPQVQTKQSIQALFELLQFCYQKQMFSPTPVISATKDHLLSLHLDKLPQNLIQAQRDYFGAHTYQRVDQEGVFSGGWEK